MSPKWTDAQLRAINERGRTILVSAAAGSGKTAVLVERVIRRITLEDCDIDSFLIVTFTRAAASEMRAKISDAISERLLAQPNDRRLRRQLTLLDRAQICTVDSFCTRLLRENFRAAGVSPDFRIADEGECRLIEEEILDELIEERYDVNDSENEGFLLLVEALSAMRDDANLQAVVLETYNKIQSHPYPDRWLERNLRLAEDCAALDPAESVYGSCLRDSMKKRALTAAAGYQAALEDMSGDEGIYKAYGAAFLRDLENIHAFLTALDGDNWDGLCGAAAAVDFSSLGSYRGADKDAAARFRHIRDGWKKAFAALREKYLSTPSEKLREDAEAVLPYARALFSLVREFDLRYSEEKSRRGILTFNDLGHGAVRLLVGSLGEDGSVEPSPAAVALSARFREIMVDEYQDTNEVQDVIFRALSRGEENLFMVGDVKQSIYRFRLADPSVFLKKYLAYADEPAPGQPVRIVLNSNFRSRKPIIEAVNYIFSSIMTSELGDVDYRGGEELSFGADYPGEGEDVEFALVETGGEDELSAAEADAVYAARRIRELLDKPLLIKDGEGLRPVEPDDIVILLRSMKGKAATYIRALERERIPVFASSEDSLFDAPEVMMLLSLLEVIDNPDEDVPLASLMRSPFYGFTADELADIRAASMKTGYYAAVRAYAEREGETAQRCIKLLTDLDGYRRDALDMPADRLILHILHSTGFEGLIGAMYGDGGRRDSIDAVLELASRYERAGYRGLYSFLALVRSLRDKGGAPKPSRAATAAVRIMSIHRSKGLEFPVVVMAGRSGRFNLRDLARPVLIHPTLGAGFRRRQTARRIDYPTLAHRAIADALRHEALSEELRVLYVGMTRAREKLILTAPVADAGKALARYWPEATEAVADPVALADCSSPLPWFLIPLSRLPAATLLLQDTGTLRLAPEANNHSWSLTAQSPVAGDAPFAAENKAEARLPISEAELLSRMSYIYPYKDAADTPSKLTATALKGRYTDMEAREEAATPRELRRFPRPRFVMGGGLTPTEKGIAQHLAMQLIDFGHCESLASINAQLKSMLERRLLSPEEAEAVDAGKIAAFFDSPLGRRLSRSPEVRREFKFSLLVPAVRELSPADIAEIPAPGEDTLLFQGVIDCYFAEDGGLVLIDFKTDRVRPGGEDEAARGYAGQLLSYAAALERITGRRVRGAYVYFFASGSAVQLNTMP